MAYFDCIVGGSGKGNTLVVTCADDLAGATITCTNGTKTYSKTCPSTAPYEVTFYGLEAGTWTLSATVSGNTYTATVVITDCAALLGGFNWRTWVDTAQFLDSSDYNSLNEVLADELAIRELCLEHACVDYMAEITTDSADVETIINTDLFAKWANNSDYALDFLHANEIIADYMDEADKYFYGEWVITDDTTTPPTWGAKGNVPVMTGASAPYGTASASRTNSGYDAYKAFDGNDSTLWSPNGSNVQVGDWISYISTTPICIKGISVLDGDAWKLGKFKIQGSNDGSNWVDVSEEFTKATGGVKEFFSFNNEQYYLQHRLYVTELGATKLDLHTLQFYGRELKVSVPKMTSNNAPYGEVIFSGEQDGAGTARYLFDRSTSTGATMTPLSNHESYIGYDFGKPVVVRGHARCLYRKYNIFYATTMKVQGSNDKNTWDTVYEYTNPTQMTDQEMHYYWYDNAKAYRYWRLFADDYYSSYNSTYYGISGYILQFFCEDYSEKEFEEGATKKWLYDHGVELVEFQLCKGSSNSGGYPIKESNEVYNAPLSGTPGSTNYSLMGATIDLTNYSLLRACVGSKAQVNMTMNIWKTNAIPPTNGSYDGNGVDSSLDVSVPCSNPNTVFALDVSSFNEQKFVAIGSFYDNNRQVSFNEWWLE